MSNSIHIRRATVADIPAIAAVAKVTWLAHYPGIISFQQIFYMLSQMYDAEILRRDMEAGQVIFFVALNEDEISGFASIGPAGDPGEFHLHKLYVHPAVQKRGVGWQLFQASESYAKEAGGKTVVLHVNKKNQSALETYRRYGFEKREEVCRDIGSGFVMDDFILHKPLKAI